MTIANEPPAKDHVGMPRLTVEMAARIQGFPVDWKFMGKKTPAYRQVGNAFPPPVAHAVAAQIHECLAVRKQVYEQARSQNPSRWTGKTRNWDRIDEVYLNPGKGPSEMDESQVA